MGLLNIFKKNKPNYHEWQNIVCSGYSENLLTKAQLLELSSSFIEQRGRIINDCVKLINETRSIDVYFSRYELLIEKLNELSLLEPYISFNQPLPSQQLKTILLEKDLRTKDLFIRAWNNTKLNIVALKTAKSKLNKVNKFFNESYSYIDQLGEESLKYLAELKKTSESTLSHSNDIKNTINFDYDKEQQLLHELNKCQNAVDKHYAYIELQNFYYKYRELDNDALDKCIKYCNEDIDSLDTVNEEYLNNRIKMELDVMSCICSKKELENRINEIKLQGFNASIPAFKRLAIIYEKQGNYEEGINICKKAIQYGETADGTAGGFESRVIKLQAKIK